MIEHAVVNIVQDCVDGKWRYATSYSIGCNGSSCPLSYRRNIVDTRDEAILSGARYMKNSISGGWEYKEGDQNYKTFYNRIEAFITKFEAQIIQPSLF